MSDLLPCPCCAGAARFNQVPPESELPTAGGWYIECENKQCGVCSVLMWARKTDVKPLLAEKWNRRAAVSGERVREASNGLLVRLAEMLAHRDAMEMRAPRDVTDQHLLSIPFAPATWGDLRALLAALPLAAQPEGNVIEMRLCETEFLILKPNQKYIFTVADGCADCARLAADGLIAI